MEERIEYLFTNYKNLPPKEKEILEYIFHIGLDKYVLEGDGCTEMLTKLFDGENLEKLYY